MRTPMPEPTLRMEGTKLRAIYHDGERTYVASTTRRDRFIAVAYLPGVPGRYGGDLVVEYGADGALAASRWMGGCDTRYGPTTQVFMFRRHPADGTYEIIARHLP